MKWIDFFATGLMAGKMRPAPGTWGSLVAIPVAFALSLAGPTVYMGLTFVFCAFSIYIVEQYQAVHKVQDASEIVIDEVAGMLVALTWVPMQFSWIALGFVVFRILDIVKPPPIRQIDRKFKTPTGVVADDLVAGIATNIFLQWLLSAHPNWVNIFSL